MGIEYEIRGRENLPKDRPFIIASKHQSAWDTLIYNIIILDCAYVVKRELFWFPFFGWFLWRVGMIGIDRGGGARTIKYLVTASKQRLADGRSIVIFPQGTRTAPGTQVPYLPGISALYVQCAAPVVPTALNSGVFWPRRTIIKRPGKVIIEFLPAIDPGLPRRAFAAQLEAAIETATAHLEGEARAALEINARPD
ncbi:MAG: 1-acyl-sn-glycerol-3-phosphate acyltransferase [Alphaproteobacteria bacterium MarineAlpha4_Bin2]|nr:MAG: 1-acyl-sn-glycerol-3-phosphate acyltransferase [Alphaproteobacteria bacterium MarineAlpha4_Bin2]